MNHIVRESTLLRHAAGVPEPVLWIEAAGAKLAVMRRGKGRPVVCLHAIGHGARDFEPLADLIGDAFEIVALDWPGQGRSLPDAQPPTAQRYADILLAAMDALALEKPIVIGNSIGGTAAMIAAARAPERFSALVLCDSGGLAPLNSFARFIIACMATFFRAGEHDKRWFARAFRFYYRRMVLPLRPAREQRERIIASGYEIAPLLRAAWEGFARPQSDLRHLVPRVTCPVFIAWARSDRVIPWSVCRKAVKKSPLHRIELFRGGHAAFLENPKDFAKSFRRFVQKYLGR
jgi:pimeloyl-ACP methyl ester carboxylesterase